MYPPFTQTLAFLDGEERSPLGRRLVVVVLLLAAWGVWLLSSRTTVYAVSEEGRLLAAGAASPIQPSVAGVVSKNHLKLGATVRTGEVLIVLDASAERLRIAEERVRIESLEQAGESLGAIIEAERGLALATVRAGNSRTAAAASRAKVASDVAQLTQKQNDAMQRLREASLVSGLEALKEAEAMQQQRGLVTINSADAANAAADTDRVRKETQVRLLNLQRELGELRGRTAASKAVVAQLEWEVGRRTLTSPIDGVVADLEVLPTGAALVANQVIATVVPQAKMKWVAYFPPREAVGRIREGQLARIRIDAFPWTAYGALSGRVTSVGSEPREQRIRVEIDVSDDNPQIPLSHGMTGTTEVEVETLSPLRLLLRLSGQVAQGSHTGAPAPRGGRGTSVNAETRQ